MKKWWMFILGGLILGVAGGGIYLAATKTPKERQASTIQQPQPTNTPTPLKTWNDPAGFTLKYPESLSLDPHPEDKQNYVHLEFKDAAQPGSLIVWMTDLSKGVTTIDDWVKKEPRFAGATVFDTTLGGKVGKKVLLTQPTKQLFVGTIDEDVLVYLEVQLDDAGFWQPVADTILTNLALVAQKDAGGGNAAGTSDVSAEEEVIDEEVTVE